MGQVVIVVRVIVGFLAVVALGAVLGSMLRTVVLPPGCAGAARARCLSFHLLAAPAPAAADGPVRLRNRGSDICGRGAAGTVRSARDLGRADLASFRGAVLVSDHIGDRRRGYFTRVGALGVLDAHAGLRLSPRAVATACLVRRGRGRLSAPCPGDRLSADALRHVLPARAADNQTHGSRRRPVINFRSPRSNNHWVLASEAVLDGAAVLLTACDVPRASRGQLCLHAGIHALLSIADFLAIPHRPPEPGAEILLPEEKFNEAFSHLQSIRVPLRDDRHAAWVAFRAQRARYEPLLAVLGRMTDAPRSDWSSWTEDTPRYTPPLIRPRPQPRDASASEPRRRSGKSGG